MVFAAAAGVGDDARLKQSIFALPLGERLPSAVARIDIDDHMDGESAMQRDVGVGRYRLALDLTGIGCLAAIGAGGSGMLARRLASRLAALAIAELVYAVSEEGRNADLRQCQPLLHQRP